MKNRQIRSRQKPASKGEKVIRAITKREGRMKKHRAVAASPAAGFNDSDKNLSSKIISGLFILLLFHIFAVAAIVIHSKFNKELIEASPKTSTVETGTDKGAYDVIQEEQNVAKISKSESYTWVNPGDTYQSIAERINCDVNELKRLNKNRPIQAGRAIKTPPREVKVVSPVLEEIGNSPEVTIEQVQPDVHRIVVADPEPVVTEVKPQVTKNSFINHKFKSGETMWALSRKYKVSVDAIINANPAVKPTSIRVGTNLKIPKQ